MSSEKEISRESEDVLKEDVVNDIDDGPAGSVEERGQEFPTTTESPEETGAVERRGVTSLFSDFLQLFEKETTAEAKIRLSIEFMCTALSNSGTPRFKDFWEGRRICLPLFKENIPPKVRSQLWSSYIELSMEAKRLKEILDEQSAFAIEQIELAIQGLERDLEHYDLLLGSAQQAPLPYQCESLRDKQESYDVMQRELLLLNTLASRVNSLRKEVVKTEMRIRIKNKLLERLSLCGDRIFPRRKELIKKVSLEFIADVDKFIQSHFQDEEFMGVPLYVLREEIKQLQSIAKTLTLNTHAFTETRLKLSGCWDKIKNREKERKKETLQKRQVFRESFDLVMAKITPFAEACLTGIGIDECNRQSAEILDFMRTVELGREEVRDLKDALQKAKRGPLDRARESELQRQKVEREAETDRREKINALKEELNTLITQPNDHSAEALTAKREELQRQFGQIQLAKAEKQIIERLFKQLKDLIDDKKEKALLMLSEDDLKALDQLKAVLEERKNRRQEIKAQLENYRKLLGGSGFDFEKAMMYREIIETEKVTLEKINASIDEIEEKIEQIEG